MTRKIISGRVWRRALVGAAAVGIVITGAPMASGAGGENAGPEAVGPAAEPDVAKKDRWAVINANGTFVRGKGVESVTHTAGGGSYIVFFDKNVRACMYSGTIGLSGASGVSDPGFITTVGAAAGETGVFVTTDDIAGASAERGFHLYVGC